MAEDIRKELSKPASDKYPAEDTETFKKIFDAICDTYGLDNPVDQIIANRAATQLMTLQYCQDMLKKYGLFYENQDKDGNTFLTMNQLAYYIKQVESEFRSNIRMLKQGNAKKKDDGKPTDFTKWLETGNGKTKPKKDT